MSGALRRLVIFALTRLWERRRHEVSEALKNAKEFVGVPYGSRSLVAAVKEKLVTVIDWNFAAWIALYRI